MKKFLLYTCSIVLSILICFSIGREAFADPTKDLLKLAGDKNATPKQILDLIKAGADVNAQAIGVGTVLYRAVSNNLNLDVITVLIKNGADVNSPALGGPTILMKAASDHSNPEVIITLIKAGADINIKDKYGWAAKDYAKSNPNPEIRKFADTILLPSRDKLLVVMQDKNIMPQEVASLIKAGADVNATDHANSITVLMIAASNNPHPEVISELIKAGANVDTKGKEGWTALFLAARNNSNPEIVATLIKAGADVNIKDRSDSTALMFAAYYNVNPKVIAELIKAGANVNTIDRKGATPLMAAASGNSNPEVLKELIKSGADIRAKTFDGLTVKDYVKNNKNPAIQAMINSLVSDIKLDSKGILQFSENDHDMFVKICKNGSLKQFKDKMKQKNLSPNAMYQRFGGMTLLAIACEHSTSLEIIQFLLDEGADVNLKKFPTQNNIPIVRAAINRKIPNLIIQTLLQAGANVNAQDGGTGWTALMLAADRNYADVVDTLLQAGADVNIKDHAMEETALMYAARASSLEIVKKILEAGADINAQDSFGKTALIEAAGQNTAEVLELLLNAGANPMLKAVSESEEDDEPYLAIDCARGNPKLEGTRALKILEERTGEVIRRKVFISNASITGNKVNIRSKPTTSSKVIKQLNTGHLVKTTKQTKAKDGTWYYIQTASGTQGWVFGKYVKFK